MSETHLRKKTRRCPRCEQFKPLDAFTSNRTSPYCRECLREYCRARYASRKLLDHPGERQCKDCQKVKPLTAFSMTPHGHMNTCIHCRKLKRLYGITSEQYDTLFAAQNGKCAICGSSDSKSKSAYLVVDHDHQTGEVRGLLCAPCNAGIGSFYDNPDLLHHAIGYLAQHGYFPASRAIVDANVHFHP